MKKTHLLFILSLIFLFSSCATNISVRVQRPAELDLSYAETIAVISTTPKLDFWDYFFYDAEYEEYEIAETLVSLLESRIITSNYFTLIDSNQANYSIKNGLKPTSDVYITVNINELNTEIKIEEYKKNDIITLKYYRTLNFNLTYQIVDSKTSVILKKAQESFSCESDKVDNEKDVQTAKYLAENKLSSFISKFMKQITPYTEQKTLTLLKDKTKNPQMEYADKLAKDGRLTLAYKEFLEIYNSTGMYEAGYNAAIILVAQERYEEASELMSDVYRTSGNLKARDAIKEIQFEIQSRDKLQKQTETRENI